MMRSSPPDATDSRDRVYGVDFSGAKHAGTKIWMATGTIGGNVLKVEDCRRAEELPGSGRHLEQCLAALRHFIGTKRASAFGLDFPFGLPHKLVKEGSWEEFVLSFGDRYPSAEQFKEACLTAAGGRELKRLTDDECKPPFSPYNLRLYRQTYYGIRDVLAPLVRHQAVCVLPMQGASPSKPWVLEVCPASTLKQIGLYCSYKGKDKAHAAAREHILQAMEDTGRLSIQAPALWSRVVGDRNGDALDSIIAAFATARALLSLTHSSAPKTLFYPIEGYIYMFR